MNIHPGLIKETLQLVREFLSFGDLLRSPRSKIFEDAIGPLYNGIQPISKEYLNLFRALRDDLTKVNSAPEVRETILRFKHDREEVVFARSKLCLKTSRTIFNLG